MKKVTFNEAVRLLNSNQLVYFGKNKQLINIENEVADIGYELTFCDLIKGDWYTKV